jgi:hypothetical protein
MPIKILFLTVDFTLKEYQMFQTKSCFKVNKVCFFFQNSTERASDWISTEQGMSSLSLSYYKFNVRAAQKVLKASIHRLTNNIISSTTAVLFQKKKITSFKKLSFKKIAPVFLLLAIKLNSNIYSVMQFKELSIFYYRFLLLKLYKFTLVNIKAQKSLAVSK